jgi:cell division septal protein FtsQ
LRRRLLIVLVILSLVCGAWLITRTPLLDVDRIAVHGAGRTPVEAVREAAGIEPGQQLLDVDAAAVRARLRSLPWVTDAAVRVHWNGDVEMWVFESEPLAVAPHPGGAMLVDAEGRVLVEGPADAVGADLDLVRVEGLSPVPPGQYVDDPAGALRVASALTPGLRTRIESVIATPAGLVDLRVRPSGMAWFGRATDLPAQLRALTAVLAQVDDTDVEVYDVRVADQVVITRKYIPPPPDDTATAADDSSDDG